MAIANIEKIQQYLQNSTVYYTNSQDLLTRKELAKAGELLWGAIAEAAKALHLMVKGKPIDIHTDIKNYLERLSFEHSGQIKIARAANQLHVNFYEASLLQEEEFFEQYEYGRSLLELLMKDISEIQDSTNQR